MNPALFFCGILVTFLVLQRRVTVGFSSQTIQVGDLWSGIFGMINLFCTANFRSETSRHSSIRLRRIFTAWITIRPAMMAFDVAMAN